MMPLCTKVYFYQHIHLGIETAKSAVKWWSGIDTTKEMSQNKKISF
jgi:hypothetical protein